MMSDRISSSLNYPLPKARDQLSRFAKPSLSISLMDRVQGVLGTKFYRRALLIAGAGGAIYASWYIYQKIVEQNELMSVSSGYSGLKAYIIENVGKYTGPKRDKVVIHCSPRGCFTPSIATAPLQLETFMRVLGIPYEVNFCSEQNGYEAPFMTYGDKTGNNFRECVRILSEKFDVNLDRNVTSSRRTASHLVDVSLENQFSWAILIWRWIHDEGQSMKQIQVINSLGDEVAAEVAEKVKEATRYHPIGQLDKEEFIKTINQGIHDISAALGRHKYFQGQSPGLVDCNAFAILVQIMWNMPGSPFEEELRKFPNLVDFIKRMKDIYWPDWDALILKPKGSGDEYLNNNYYLPKTGSKSRDPLRKLHILAK